MTLPEELAVTTIPAWPPKESVLNARLDWGKALIAVE